MVGRTFLEMAMNDDLSAAAVIRSTLGYLDGETRRVARIVMLRIYRAGRQRRDREIVDLGQLDLGGEA